jgi:hypothetical protein
MNLDDNLCSGRNRRGEAFFDDIDSHLRWMKAVNIAGGVFPVGGATGVRYTPRSADGNAPRFVLRWQVLNTASVRGMRFRSGSFACASPPASRGSV